MCSFSRNSDIPLLDQITLFKGAFLFSGKMKTKPVLIGPHPENATVVLGGVASFQCKVKSVVQPHIQVGWVK